MRRMDALFKFLTQGYKGRWRDIWVGQKRLDMNFLGLNTKASFSHFLSLIHYFTLESSFIIKNNP